MEKTQWATEEIAKQYSKYSLLEGSCYSYFGRVMLDVAGVQPNDVVCELGSGTGATSQFLIKRCSHCLLTDPNRNMLDQLSRAFKNEDSSYNLIQVAAENISEKAHDQFDKVISSFTLLHLDLQETLIQVAQILKKSGLFVISDFSKIVSFRSRKADFYDLFEEELRIYAQENSLTFENPFIPAYTEDEIRVLAGLFGFDVSFDVFYREENETALLALDLFIRRNFYKSFPDLDKEASIQAITNIAKRLLDKVGKFEYGVVFLTFKRT